MCPHHPRHHYNHRVQILTFQTRFFKGTFITVGYLSVSKNLEIKYLSTGIEMNDQTPSKESVEHENKIADENVDLDEGTTSPLNEDGGEYVESQVSTGPEIQHKSSNRRVTKELLSEAGKLKCQECERIINSQPALQHHTKSKHEGVKYACNHCDYQATAKGVLGSKNTCSI